MHEKIALIDKKIKWVGSLNILSHNTKKEYMERIEGKNSSKELFEKFNLDDLLIQKNINGEICPKCNSNFIALRFSYKNRQYFYSCSGYPDCDFTANSKTRNLDNFINNSEKGKTTKIQQAKVSKDKPVKISTKLETTLPTKKSTVNEKDGTQWETPLTFWSSVKLPGYRYSEKKKAWWKKK